MAMAERQEGTQCKKSMVSGKAMLSFKLQQDIPSEKNEEELKIISECKPWGEKPKQPQATKPIQSIKILKQYWNQDDIPYMDLGLNPIVYLTININSGPL